MADCDYALLEVILPHGHDHVYFCLVEDEVPTAHDLTHRPCHDIFLFYDEPQP